MRQEEEVDSSSSLYQKSPEDMVLQNHNAVTCYQCQNLVSEENTGYIEHDFLRYEKGV